MWPVHTWLPDAHVEAPTAGSVILAGVLLKLGGYGFVRFSLPMFPLASAYFTPLMFALSAIAVIYTSFVALAQTDMKKLIAYSSIAHMGFVTMGIFALTSEAVQGAMVQMLSHGLVSAALFLIVGVVYDRLHTRDIDRYGGLADNMPAYAFVFMCMMLASVGLPGTSGFVGEFLILLGTFRVSTLECFLAATALFLGAMYMLYLYRRVVFGTITRDDVRAMFDLTPREKAIFAPLLVLVLWMGVYPNSFLTPIRTSVDHLVQQVHAAQQAAANQVPAQAGPIGQLSERRKSGSPPPRGPTQRVAADAPRRPSRPVAGPAGDRAGLRRHGIIADRRVPRRGLHPARLVAVCRRAARRPRARRHLRGRTTARLLRHVRHRRIRRVHQGAGADRLGGQRSSWRCATTRSTRSRASSFRCWSCWRRPGMMVMVSANDLITLYLGLELQSLALYVVAAFDRDSVRSSEAGLKYFVLGALSSGMLLYGASLIYGFAGTTSFAGLAAAVRRRHAAVGRADHRPCLRHGRPRLQGLGGAVPHVDARCLRGRADAGHRILLGRAEDGGDRAVRALPDRAVRRRCSPSGGRSSCSCRSPR